MAQKKPRLILPVGEAVFPHLNEVDVYQPVDKKGRPSGAQKRQYITYVRYPEATLKKIEAAIRAKAAEIGADADVKLPLKKIKGKDGSKETVIKATSGEKFRPPVWDTKNNKVPFGVVIGGGSKIALDVSVNHYEGFGGGINLYINAVQLHELVEGGQTKSNFAEADGFTFEESDATDQSEEAADHNDGDDAALSL